MTGKVRARKVEESDSERPRDAESMWGRLMDWNLSLWSEEQEFTEGAMPLVQIPVNRDTCILEEGTPQQGRIKGLVCLRHFLIFTEQGNMVHCLRFELCRALLPQL